MAQLRDEETQNLMQRQPSGRGRAALAVDFWPVVLPDTVIVTAPTLITVDGEVTKGTLYRPQQGSRIVYCLMHPRQDLRQHPLIPEFLEAGHAVWAQVGRDVGNDLRLVHENALLDVAAGMEWLRQCGFEHIVLVGHSGGAGLYTYYAEQAQKQPEARMARTPGGAPTKLPDAPMPVPDALVLVAPHPGQGKLLQAAIDPSIVDESDPLSVESNLDPFNPDNGFATAEDGGSRYSDDFVIAYRAAQVERVERIDAYARKLITERLTARKKVKAGNATYNDKRRGILTPVITTYRTDADLRCTDLHLDRSERPYGSVISAKPAVSNYGVTGFGRLTTPEAWLSTWSGVSSHASVTRAIAGVRMPTMIVEFTGDCSVFPSDIAAAIDAADTQDVAHVQIRADHFGRPLADGEPAGMPRVAREVTAWTANEVAR